MTTPADFERLFPATGGALYGRASHGWTASFSRPGATQPAAGPLSGGRQHASGSGRADGGPVGADRGGDGARGPRLRRAGRAGRLRLVVRRRAERRRPPRADADRLHRQRLFALLRLGAPPRPAAAGPTRAHYCALNVALYGAGGQALGDDRARPRERCAASAHALEIGPSALAWDGRALTVRIDEITAPLPSRIRGTVRLAPGRRDRATSFALDDEALHRWSPIAPVRASRGRARSARAAVGRRRLPRLERGRRAARARLHAAGTGRARRLCRRRYGRALRRQPAPRAATSRSRSGSTPRGGVERFEPPPRCRAAAERLAGGARHARPTPAARARVVQTLEDAPFYARSLVAARALRRAGRRRAREPVARPLPVTRGCRCCCPSGCRARAGDAGYARELRSAASRARGFAIAPFRATQGNQLPDAEAQHDAEHEHELQPGEEARGP